MSELNFPTPVQDAPPTTRLVYLSLDWADRPLTARELARRTCSPKRSVLRSLNKLQEMGYVTEAPNASDGRRRHYRLAPDAP